MNDFDLPIISDVNFEKRILSMDEYLEFVMFNLQNVNYQIEYGKLEKVSPVYVQFSFD